MGPQKKYKTQAMEVSLLLAAFTFPFIWCFIRSVCIRLCRCGPPTGPVHPYGGTLALFMTAVIEAIIDSVSCLGAANGQLAAQSAGLCSLH